MGYSVGLSVRDWNQVNQGGAYSIPPGYIDYERTIAHSERDRLIANSCDASDR